MSPQFEILLIGIITAVACALPGAFLILRGMSMMSDSITHTVLLGIVIAFFITGDLLSPLLYVGATLMGVFTVYSTESLKKTRLLSEDASLGVVFPFLFSIAIILITRYSDSVHIDTDAVLLGELAFAPFDRAVIFGVDIGAASLYSSTFTLIINTVFIMLIFKELAASTFDPLYASVVGVRPNFMHYTLMTLVSFTAVSAFDTVGSVLVIAFMIAPGACAYLLTHRLGMMLILSVVFAAFSAILGFLAAYALDISISGSMAVCAGIIFLIVFMFAPQNGLISGAVWRRSQKIGYMEDMLILYLKEHTCLNDDENDQKCCAKNVCINLGWDKRTFARTVKRLLCGKYVSIQHGTYALTNKGIERAENAHSKIG